MPRYKYTFLLAFLGILLILLSFTILMVISGVLNLITRHPRPTFITEFVILSNFLALEHAKTSCADVKDFEHPLQVLPPVIIHLVEISF